jgi:hypothetical protein
MVMFSPNITSWRDALRKKKRTRNGICRLRIRISCATQLSKQSTIKKAQWQAIVGGLP